ncbi:bcl-2-like protein 12 isoform X3 [Mirounga angustirostris]|uniref:bcl-2-like protein 12 isoform X3 n=1 Tax=Mirounga angustirostris TaxID=9716 RepID=UPI00313D4E61
MAGSEELGLREDTVRVLAAFFRRGEPAGSPIPTPPRVTGSPTHREGSPTAEAGGLAGGRGRSHQSEAGLGPRPAQKAGPPLRGLLRPPSGALLQTGGQPSCQPPTPQLALPWAPAAFPGAPGPSGPGHGAEPPRGPAGGHPGRTQCGARAQLWALDPGTRGLGGHPGHFTRGLELTPGLRSSSEAATRLDLLSLCSLCAFPSLPIPLRVVGWWLPSLFLPKRNCLKFFHIKNFFRY